METDRAHGDAAMRLSTKANALAGDIGFLSPEAQMQRTNELLGEGALVVRVPALPQAMRGRLAEHVDEHVEHELARHGAPAPYLAAWTTMPEDAETRISEQLFRARTVGATGIAIAMGSFAAAATRTRSLTPEDSAFLRMLVRTTKVAPLVVLLDDADAATKGYEEPIAITTWVGSHVNMNVQVHAHVHADESETRLVDTHVDTKVAPVPPPIESATLDEDDDDASDESENSADALSVAPAAQVACVAPVAPVAPLRVVAEVADVTEMTEMTEVAARPADLAEVAARPVNPVRRPPSASAPAGRPTATPHDFWRSWALSLSAAKGPQPLATFQRLFVESYMPLANAIAEGVDDVRAVRAYDEFRASFERAYADAFATFGVTNRRPRLVMDAYDFASKQARLHNARVSHVLVVDSMRFDLGELVRDVFADRCAGMASLTAEALLFSALPTTTIRQLETIARGIDALRDPVTEDPIESLRGRSAEIVRRLRVGSRELYKLDVVPGILASLEEHAQMPMRNTSGSERVIAGWGEIAEAVSDALVRHIETLQQRTLLLVVGDHGFCLDRRGRITHGGSAPEEVLVPALAYLVGDLH